MSLIGKTQVLTEIIYSYWKNILDIMKYSKT